MYICLVEKHEGKKLLGKVWCYYEIRFRVLFNDDFSIEIIQSRIVE
jgi:hypothetical protein